MREGEDQLCQENNQHEHLFGLKHKWIYYLLSRRRDCRYCRHCKLLQISHTEYPPPPPKENIHISLQTCSLYNIKITLSFHYNKDKAEQYVSLCHTISMSVLQKCSILEYTKILYKKLLQTSTVIQTGKYSSYYMQEEILMVNYYYYYLLKCFKIEKLM